MSTAARPRVTTTTALLYWLLIICGLVGISVARFDAPHDLLPLWIGTVVGVAIGQCVSWSRIGGGLITAINIGVLWCMPMILALLYQTFGLFDGSLETCALAFFPAAICGYLSLSERAGLAAFWYPAVLWMVVILDRPGTDGAANGAFEARGALPLLIGLAVLFVAFFRAGETRRAAIWQGFAARKLATPVARKVLRKSPVRSAAQHAWTGLTGAAALVLAAWIAPHLWQKDIAKVHGASAVMVAAADGRGSVGERAASGQLPCCHGSEIKEPAREHVKEYFPLLHGRDVGATGAVDAACVVCGSGSASESGTGSASESGTGSASGSGWSGSWSGVGEGSGVVTYNNGVTTMGADAVPIRPAPPTTATTAVTAVGNGTSAPVPVPAAVPAPVSAVASPAAAVTTPAAAVATPAAPTTKALVGTVAQEPPAARVASAPPWRAALFFCIGALALHVLVRAIRRKVTLRHLTRPFWAEHLDQRISNHWQRVLIGLRDAGIEPGEDEQPHALARRVGIDGLDTCATILERVRHGVRVEAGDLDAMAASAGAVYRAAREKAGISGRAAALIRWPL